VKDDQSQRKGAAPHTAEQSSTRDLTIHRSILHVTRAGGRRVDLVVAAGMLLWTRGNPETALVPRPNRGHTAEIMPGHWRPSITVDQQHYSILDTPQVERVASRHTLPDHHKQGHTHYYVLWILVWQRDYAA